MRTTVTLDEDVAQRVKQLGRERDIPFKEALNTTLRAGLADESPASKPYTMPTQSLGLRPGVNLDKALERAEVDEDEEAVRKLSLRK